ncbi:site-specific integrase [Pseudomonas sp. CYM-20-01]|uniref:site-specific integrase n=1 Tax=Pseudomonas sp. CYM-20-01 TaxID=2870750 RepID=UPI0020BF3911|nr:site-specific integrase [Pseudomonas sp. CYM-20-01]
MALIAQPFRHPDSGIYYLRRRVPDDIRPVIGRTEIRRSLNTRNHHEAKAAFALAYAESERFFHQVRNDNSVPVGTPLFNAFSMTNCAHTKPEYETASSTKPNAIRLSETFLRYTESIGLASKPAHVIRRHTVDYKRAVDRFIALVADHNIAEIGPKHIQDFAEKLTKSFVKHSNTPLATSSIRLIIARLSSVFSYAVDTGLMAHNPVSTSRINKRLGSSKPKRMLDDDKGYEWNELIKIFSQPEFKALRHTTGRPGNALFWLPIIAAYTGARREEISQLYVCDLRQDTKGQWFMRIDDDKPDKSVKTEGSRRDIPLHDDLLTLGILELVAGKDRESRLFPQLVKVSDGFAGIVSKAWRPMVIRWGVYRKGRHPLHGFRHTFKTLAREYGIAKELSDWITGHASGHIGDSYGINPLSRMSEEIRKLPSIAKAAGLLPTAEEITSEKGNSDQFRLTKDVPTNHIE